MEFFADSPRFVKKRFHAVQSQVTHLKHSETCCCLKCSTFARTEPKLGIQIPDDIIMKHNRLVGGQMPTSYSLAGFKGAEVSANSTGKMSAKNVKHRDYEWLVRKLKSSTIIGVNNLYKNEMGNLSYDVDIKALIPGGAAAEADDMQSVVTSRRTNTLDDKIRECTHYIMLPDTIFFEKGKPVRYYFTKNMDDDILNRPGSHQKKKKAEKHIRKSAVDDTPVEDEWGNPTSCRTVTSMLDKLHCYPTAIPIQYHQIKLRSSAELITIAKDFWARALASRRRKIAYDKKILELQIQSSSIFNEAVRETKWGSGGGDETEQMALANKGSHGLKKSNMRDPYIIHPGLYTNKMAITSFDTNLAPVPPNPMNYPNGIIPPEIQAEFEERSAGKIPRKGKQNLQGIGGTGWSANHQTGSVNSLHHNQWGTKFEADHAQLMKQRLEIMKINYADGAVRLWSEREVEEFCSLRKPKRQDFLDIVSVQNIPLAGLGGYTNLQFITYNYNDHLLPLKKRMRQRSPERQREAAVYDPSPKHNMGPGQWKDSEQIPVPMPFRGQNQGGAGDHDDTRIGGGANSSTAKSGKTGAGGAQSRGASTDPKGGGAGAKSNKNNKSTEKGVPGAGAAAQDKHASKEIATKGDSKDLLDAEALAALESEEQAKYMSPDLERIQGYFPEAKVVCAKVVNGQIVMPQLPSSSKQRAASQQQKDGAGNAGPGSAKKKTGGDKRPGSKDTSAKTGSKQKTHGSDRSAGSKDHSPGSKTHSRSGSAGSKSKSKGSSSQSPSGREESLQKDHHDANVDESVSHDGPGTATASGPALAIGKRQSESAAPKVPEFNLNLPGLGGTGSGPATGPGPGLLAGLIQKKPSQDDENPYGIMNVQKEAMMEEAVSRINEWLDKKYNLKIISGAFEFGFAFQPRFTELEYRLVGEKQDEKPAERKRKAEQTIAISPDVMMLAFAAPKPMLRCFLVDAQKLVVQRTIVPNQFRADQKLATEASEAENQNGPSILGELTGASDNEAGQMPVSSDPDTSPNTSADEIIQGRRRKKTELKTAAGKNMLEKMNGLWTPLQGSDKPAQTVVAPARSNTTQVLLKGSADNSNQNDKNCQAGSGTGTKGLQNEKTEPKVDEQALLIQETVLAAGNCIAIDHSTNFAFMAEAPPMCTAKDNDAKNGPTVGPGKLSSKAQQAENVRRQRNAPIGSLLLQRCDSTPSTTVGIPSARSIGTKPPDTGRSSRGGGPLGTGRGNGSSRYGGAGPFQGSGSNINNAITNTTNGILGQSQSHTNLSSSNTNLNMNQNQQKVSTPMNLLNGSDGFSKHPQTRLGDTMALSTGTLGQLLGTQIN